MANWYNGHLAVDISVYISLAKELMGVLLIKQNVSFWGHLVLYSVREDDLPFDAHKVFACVAVWYGTESCPVLACDERSLAFTVTRSFMNRGKWTQPDFFHFLPTANQIDIRTAKFLRKFMANENPTCQMFIKKADLKLRKILAHINAILVEKLTTLCETTFV